VLTGTSSWAATASNLTGGTANYLPLWTSVTLQSSSNIYQSSSGNIGIGTITPATRLDVNGGISIGGGQVISASATYTQLIRRDGSVGIYLGGSGDPNSYYDNTNHYFRDVSGATTRMIINSAGNVGIGTTSPGSTLHVQGNVSASSYTSSLGFLVTGSTGYRHTSGSVGAVLRANSTTNAVEFGAETNHVVNMTINNTPTYQFGAGAFIPIFAAYNLGALINPWDKVYATTVSASSYNSSLTSGVGFFGTASYALSASYAPSTPSVSASYAATASNLTGGTANYIPLWVNASLQSSSNMYQSASNIGIGITNPSASLHVSGTMAVQSIFEKVTVTASAAPATLNYNILDQAILFHSASSTANWTLNFRGDASRTLNSVMSTGQSLTTTLMVLNTTTAYSASAYQIDGTTIRPRWQGGTSGSANTNSLDAHTFTIIKTSATPTYVLLGSITKYT
jgi:hypothetical protein